MVNLRRHIVGCIDYGHVQPVKLMSVLVQFVVLVGKRVSIKAPVIMRGVG
jgi:hypothetical protein